MKINARKWVLMLAVILTCMSFAGVVNAKDVVTVWSWSGPEWESGFKQIKQEFEKEYPNIELRVEFMPFNGYFSKLQVSAAGGSLPDVIKMPTFYMGQYIAMGIAEDLRPYIEKDKVNLNDFYPHSVAAVKMPTKEIIGLPHEAITRALIYNKGHLDKAGLAYPSKTKPMSFEDVLQYAQKLTKKDSKGNLSNAGFQFRGANEMYTIFLMSGLKIWDNPMFPKVCLLDSPSAAKAADKYRDLMYKHHVMPTSEEFFGGLFESTVGSGNISMAIGGQWNFDQMTDSGIKFGVAPLPDWSGKNNRGMDNGVNVWLLSKKSKEKEAAWKFIRWSSSTDKGVKAMVKAGIGMPAYKPVAASDWHYKAFPKVPAEEMKALVGEVDINKNPVIYRKQEAERVFLEAWKTIRDDKVINTLAAMRKLANDVTKALK